MNVCVFGLWHLGSVISTSVAEHFTTVGCDPDAEVIADLKRGIPPLFEPGLEDLLKAGIASGNLAFTTNLAEAVPSADVLWIGFDTAVNDRDEADVDALERSVVDAFPYLRDGARVVTSSQASAGFTNRVSHLYAQAYPDRAVKFIYSPENLRLGSALGIFQHPERIVVGTSDGRPDPVIAELLAPFSDNILWMSTISAEMTKHTINAYLATTLSFINEIAALCETVGADAKDVERGLRTDIRVGERAYVSPGAGFAGGTLARDISFLKAMGERAQTPIPLLASVQASNDNNKAWPQRTLTRQLGSLDGKRVAMLGLTYKPGTDTLRRSSAVELGQWIAAQGATVVAFDPAVKALPAELTNEIRLATTIEEAASGADALVVATEWPEFRQLDARALTSLMRNPVVIDVKRFLGGTFESEPGIRYFAVGKSSEPVAP